MGRAVYDLCAGGALVVALLVAAQDAAELQPLPQLVDAVAQGLAVEGTALRVAAGGFEELLGFRRPERDRVLVGEAVDVFLGEPFDGRGRLFGGYGSGASPSRVRGC